ncbi:unnamed protein product [Schistosoma curassoni]|nr:unnamed protein product [Schistosoma curassoni]
MDFFIKQYQVNHTSQNRSHPKSIRHIFNKKKIKCTHIENTYGIKLYVAIVTRKPINIYFLIMKQIKKKKNIISNL